MTTVMIKMVYKEKEVSVIKNEFHVMDETLW